MQVVQVIICLTCPLNQGLYSHKRKAVAADPGTKSNLALISTLAFSIVSVVRQDEIATKVAKISRTFMFQFEFEFAMIFPSDILLYTFKSAETSVKSNYDCPIFRIISLFE